MDDVFLLGDSDEVVVTFQNSAGTEVTDVVDAVEKVMAEVGPQHTWKHFTMHYA